MNTVEIKKSNRKHIWELYVNNRRIGEIYFTHSKSKHLWFRMISCFVHYKKGVKKGKESFERELRNLYGISSDWNSDTDPVPTFAGVREVITRYFSNDYAI